MLRPVAGPGPSGSGFQFRYVKGAVFAAATLAVAVSIFDLTNIHVAEPAARFINKNYQRVADVPGRIRSQIDRAADRISDRVSGLLRPAGIEPGDEDAVTTPPAETDVVTTAALPAVDMTPETANSKLLRARLPSPAALMHLTASTLGKAKQCLARAIYFEARNEPVRGQIAVAQVVVNRVFSGFYPNDLCDVVYQNASRHLDCQFTFACDGRSKLINERGAWARAEQIAGQVLAGDLYDTAVGTSTHYHALYVRPDWTPEMKKLIRYGTHSFYRPAAWGSGADAPVWGMVPLPPDKGKAE